MNITPINPHKRSGILDLLRFLAVTVVFLTHYFDTYNFVYNIVPANLKYMPIFHYGSTSLVLFFMISGYVVTMTSIKKDIRSFLVTRLSRLYPLFWVSCVVAFILPRIIHDHTYLTFSNLSTFIANLTMVPELLGYIWINPVFHTLFLELIFYIFISFIIIFKLWKNILTIIFLIMLLYFGISLDKTVLNHIFIPPFIGGMLFYFIKAKSERTWILYSLLIINYLSMLLAGHIMVAPLNSYYKDPNAINFWIIALIFTILYILFYLIATDKINIRATRFSTKLGELAYPVYLFHIYFMFIYWSLRDSISGELLVALLFILTMIVSYPVNLYIEKPLTKLTAYFLDAILSLFAKTKPSNRKQSPG